MTFGLSCILLVKGRRKRLAFTKVSVTIVQSSPPVRYFEPPQYDCTHFWEQIDLPWIDAVNGDYFLKNSLA